MYFRKMDTHGRIVIPTRLRGDLDIGEGDILEIECVQEQIIIKKRKGEQNEN